jgi:ankyrin repeat protein
MATEEVVEAIFRAAREGDVDIVAGMLDEDLRLLSLLWKGDTLLNTAVRDGHVHVVRLLLERGLDINQANAHGTTALICAASWGREEMVSILLTSGADPSRRGYRGQTVLMRASIDGDVAVVRLLLRSMGCRGFLGRGLNERSEDGRTALCYACRWGHTNVVRALLLAGADHTIADSDDTTPLQAAEEREHHECVGVIQVSSIPLFCALSS